MVRLSDVIGVSIMIHLTYTVSCKLYQKLTEEDETVSVISRISSISSINSIVVKLIDVQLLNKSASRIQKCWLSKVQKVQKVPEVPEVPEILDKSLELEYEFIQDYQGLGYEYVQNL